ncbi:hypothetical protein M430DRAFT_49170 [Amorphotheca resinae ATCC 22711]|uniref:Mediator of RNA polymerase II transcription subunit 31 n=1 Tax=Amorphotheca resinae ATCC 22711 TaxID=857342 RepID=A0A2T3B5F3_AMORE|nr:hypothetical protein M430DRAFT_49170 [Amorphotheca resinae ATCC 22711]PSS21987.1 hypothetical protein M430DRAFT_49170 [Amorphotheca resinae ATCC 22711]
MATSVPEDSIMSENQAPPPIPAEEPKYGGFTRFEIELEFVQCLASPTYLNHLASKKYFENPEFLAYLKYLQYFAHPPYLKYLVYPGPTLRNLELLQQERFRTDILSGETVARMVEEGAKAGMEWPSKK